MPNGAKKKIVIVGGGAAGVFTAYLLEKHAPGAFDLTILEKNAEVGGHTRSRGVVENGVTVHVDSGAQFFSRTSQPDYTKMLEDEGFFAIPGLISESPVGITLWDVTKDQRLFHVPADEGDLFSELLQHPVAWAAFAYLTAAAIEHFVTEGWEKTFGEWLDDILAFLPIGDAEKESFKADLARPLMYQFGLVAPDAIDDLSARFVLYYFVGSLPWDGGFGAFRVYNVGEGLDGILTRLLDGYGLAGNLKLGSDVASVAPVAGGYLVTTTGGATFAADEVVFAINPKRILDVLPDADPTFSGVRTELSGMKYLDVPVRIQQQQSPAYMPGDAGDWAVSNVLVVDDPVTDDATHYMLTIWFGPLRPEPEAAHFFKSWGSPHLVPPNAPHLYEQIHELMVGTPDFIARRKKLREDHQGVHDLWYVGGYLVDYDSQNACLKSAALVASAIVQEHLLEPLVAEAPFQVTAVEPSATPQEEAFAFLPEAQLKGRPELLDRIDRRLLELADEHPEILAWRRRQPAR